MSRIPMRHLALLRGLNVGSHNRITMKDLAAVFIEAGCAEVQTYIQSGNVVFSAPAAVGKQVPGKVAELLEKRFSITSPVVLRDGKALQAVVKHNPFLPGADPATLHVGFLSALPAPAKVKALDPKRSPGDVFEVLGRELYLRTPKGLGNSKLTNTWFDAQLGVISTVRNWKTVLALLAMTEELS